MKSKAEEDITRRIKVVVGQLNGIRRMLEQQRAFTDISMQLSSVKASVERIQVVLVAQERKLDKRSAAMLEIITRKMDALRELQS